MQLRSEHFVPTYSNHSSPRQSPRRVAGTGAGGKTAKYGVCCCLACGPVMGGGATFLVVLMVAAYFYVEYVLGGVFTAEVAETILSPSNGDGSFVRVICMRCVCVRVCVCVWC